MVRDDRFFPFAKGDYTICQSDLSFADAMDAGILDTFGVVDVGVDQGASPCVDRATGDAIYVGYRAIGPPAGSDPYAGFGDAWYLVTPDGEVDWVYVVPDWADEIACGGFGSYGAVTFGTPFFTPDPRYVDCD